MLNRSTRALIAGLLWAAIGIMLLVRGLALWNVARAVAPDWLIPALAMGLVLGGAKGFFVLRKSSARMIRRIENGPMLAPVWQMYPPYLYLLIPLMIGFGIWLRSNYADTYPTLVLGVYVGIGAALLASTLPFFAAAKRLKAPGAVSASQS